MSAGNWCLIESDPGVFTELIERIGVQGIQVDELYSLEEEELNQRQPVYGLIFLFKITRDSSRTHQQPIQHDVPDLFFARQVINNACATQAILSILMNLESEGADIGDTLRQFKEFTMGLDPEMRGLAISNSDQIRDVHNSFARQETFSVEGKTASDDDDIYHFIAYVPHNGRVYELDGIQSAPIDHGPYENNWTSVAIPVLQKRIEQSQAGEIRFNLMAVCGDRRAVLEEKVAELEAQVASLNVQDPDHSATLHQLRNELEEAREHLQHETAQRLRWTKENARRKHNYIPLFLQLLRELARTKQLMPLVERAKQLAQSRATTEASTPKKRKIMDEDSGQSSAA